MLDPACEYETFGDALTVGRACDEANFFWYEDPYHDGGLSVFAQRRLREMISTPILMGEHVRTLEPKVDMVVGGATDYMRVNPTYDMGITGAMKVAHAAEGFGLDVELHGGGPAQRHCMASIRNTNYYELGLVHPMRAGLVARHAATIPTRWTPSTPTATCRCPTVRVWASRWTGTFIEAHRTGLKSYE